MALTLGSGIDYQGTENNFARDYFENLADMVAMRAKSLPKMFIAMCGETGKAYLYNKSAEADEALGKWRELPLGGEGSSSGSGVSIYQLPMESVEGEENFPDYSYERFCFRREQNLLTAVKGDLHDAPEVGTFVKYDKSSYDGYPEIYQLTVFGYTDTGMDMAGTKWVFKPLIDRDGRGTITIKYNPYNTEINEGYIIEEAEASAEVPEEETDTIDFSTWPEFSPNLDAGGITLDGHGGANVDGSNVSVDPDDIEPDD